MWRPCWASIGGVTREKEKALFELGWVDGD
jgi:hypothetical protein